LHHLGLGPRAQAAMGLNLKATEDHIRYLREFRVVDTVEVRSAPVEVGERDLTIYHEVRNAADNALASTIRRRIECDRPWPAAFRVRAQAAKIEQPVSARPRSVGHAPLPSIKFADCARIGLIDAGRTVVKTPGGGGAVRVLPPRTLHLSRRS